MRVSCIRCRAIHRACSGDSPCSACISRGETCTPNQQRPRKRLAAIEAFVDLDRATVLDRSPLLDGDPTTRQDSLRGSPLFFRFKQSKWSLEACNGANRGSLANIQSIPEPVQSTIPVLTLEQVPHYVLSRCYAHPQTAMYCTVAVCNHHLCQLCALRMLGLTEARCLACNRAVDTLLFRPKPPLETIDQSDAATHVPDESQT